MPIKALGARKILNMTELSEYWEFIFLIFLDYRILGFNQHTLSVGITGCHLKFVFIYYFISLECTELA